MKSVFDFFRVILMHLRMLIDRLMGRVVILVHPNTIGQMQFLEPIFDALMQESQPVSFYLATDYDYSPDAIENYFSAGRCLPSRLSTRMRFAQVYLQPEIYGRGPRQAVKIFTGHGQPNKHTNWYDENLLSFDWYFLYGDLERDMFELIREEKPEQTAHIRLLEAGYPKADKLIRGEYDREAVLRELGLDPSLKTILYAPAWDPGGAVRTHGIAVPEKLLEMKDVNVLVKLHPGSLEPEGSPYWQLLTGGEKWSGVFSSLEHDRYRYIETFLIDPLLAAADVMVTDFSGVALEFMTQDRPVVYLHCPAFYEVTLPEWGNDPKMALEDDRFNAGRNAGIVAWSLDSLIQCVEAAMTDPEDVRSRRNALMNRFLYHPGNAGAVNAQLILEAVDWKGPRATPQPIV